MAKEYFISFKQEKCVQCYGCETACKSWRGIEPGIKLRSIANVWLGNYPDIKSYASTKACMHCVDPECVRACPEKAIEKRAKDGIVMVNKDACSGCRSCLDACPYKVPQFGEDGRMQKCDLCAGTYLISGNPPCVATCPTGALSLIMTDSEIETISFNS